MHVGIKPSAKFPPDTVVLIARNDGWAATKGYQCLMLDHEKGKDLAASQHVSLPIPHEVNFEGISNTLYAWRSASVQLRKLVQSWLLAQATEIARAEQKLALPADTV